MQLKELLQEITPLPWRFAPMDNDKVISTIRLFGRRKHHPSKEVWFGRLDSVGHARHACHAATVLPDAVGALDLLLADQKRPKSELACGQFEFCESALAQAKTITTKGEPLCRKE